MKSITTYSATEPERVAFFPQRDGSAEVYLRRNIRQEPDGEDGTIWAADEVFIRTRLSREEVEARFDNYFEEEIETTIEDLAEAIEILTHIILEG